MKLEDFGEWTEVCYKDFKRDWLPGHVTFEKAGLLHRSFIGNTHKYKDVNGEEVFGFAHYTNGKFQKGFGNQKYKTTIPEFEMVSNPMVNIREVRQKRFNVIERAEQVKKDLVKAAEDIAVWESLDEIKDSHEGN